MSAQKTADGYCPNPRRPLKHRADCADFYREPEDNACVSVRGPRAVLQAIEEASERAGRTFNAHMLYVIEACRGRLPLLADEERTEEEWRMLLQQLELRFDEGEEWIGLALGSPRTAPRAS
ncbi:MAG: hypothetical protein Nkreftii_002710 [Candidatus Nitrospira kreftii]|uniref:Uncharacterized protein n=1 Tax=Candidatus Nitrospira kreftii TaxID=2652173 RepID=A0A7S8J046_9BACT|nr:MAG: hypothetical protein Nkreftii_002710 [Candidatus Nitrospira kreftii]